MPVVEVEVDGLALTMLAVTMTVCNDSVNKQCLLVGHAKVKRCYVYGYGDTDVVGIDLRQSGFLLCIADGFGTGGELQRKEESEKWKEKGENASHCLSFWR